MWDALSAERMGLSFTIAAGPHQHSNFYCSPYKWYMSSIFTVLIILTIILPCSMKNNKMILNYGWKMI
jgi:hypothetical protein